MGKGKRYDQDYKDMIVDLYKSGMTLSEISSEYGIAKSTINGWIKDVKEIKVDENDVMTLKEVKELKKEMARIKEENEELKSAIIRIYKANKGIYGAPRIHHILKLKGFNVSLKRVQRRMTELGLCAITVKKYKPHSNKKVAEGLENVLKRDFTTTSINEK
ncbi:IS3 family transposase [Inconstantimicrobium porci]|uniref:IS3 family transposase n=1 Tax=Inconstantimicrobium porci TaxID=2652291 RepID=UPI00389A864F